MAIMINGNTPETYGVTVAGWSEATLTASTLNLEVVAAAYDGAQAFEYGDTVVIEDGATQLFLGTITSVPIQGSGTSEGQTYIVSDAWADLEKIVMQTVRTYFIPSGTDDPPVEQEKLFSVVSFSPELKMGQRVRAVLEYAISKGARLQIDSISEGIDWWRTEYKNQACSEILRDIMRTMPDHQLYVNVRTSPATISMRARSSLSTVSIDLAGGNVLDHKHEDLHDQVINQVILRYEYQNTVDDVTTLQILEDSAGGDDGIKGAVIESIEMVGSTATFEYAPIVAEAIPTETDPEQTILEWLVNHTPELKRIADEFGLEQVLAVLELATDDDKQNGIYQYKRSLTPEPARAEPRGTNGTPIEPSDDIEDYPNELIEGTITDWMRKRHRLVNVVASIALKDVTNTPGEMVQALYGLMLKKRTFGGKNYRIAKIEGSVMATNARTKNYNKLVSGTPAEEIPEGLAAQILAQYGVLRRSGSVTLKAAEISNSYQLGQKLNLENGKAAWATMTESITGVDLDIASGQTTVSYGPVETMGTQDFIEKLRASRRNIYTVAPRDDSSAQQEAVGGALASPQSIFTLSSEAGTDKPFLLTVWKEGGVYKYNVSSETSSIVDASANPYDLSSAGLDIDKTITASKYIVLEATIADGEVTTWELKEVDKADSKEIGFNTADPPVQVAARLLIGQVHISAGVIRKTQHVSTCQILNNFFQSGELLKGFTSYPYTD
jgi:hypothetical protein